MSTFIEALQIGDQIVWVEVADLIARESTAETAKTSVTGALSKVAEIDIRSTISALARPFCAVMSEVMPAEATLEVSLGIKGEVGVFVAKSEGNASLKVTMKWVFHKDESA